MKKIPVQIAGLVALAIIVALVATGVNNRSASKTDTSKQTSANDSSAPKAEASKNQPGYLAVAEVGYDEAGRPVAVRPVVFDGGGAACVGDTHSFDDLERPFAMTCGSFVAEDNSLRFLPIPIGRLDVQNLGELRDVRLQAVLDQGRKGIRFAAAGVTPVTTFVGMRSTNRTVSGPASEVSCRSGQRDQRRWASEWLVSQTSGSRE